MFWPSRTDQMVPPRKHYQIVPNSLGIDRRAYFFATADLAGTEFMKN